MKSPQPNCNANQTLNQKQLFLQRLMEDEVAGLCSLLLSKPDSECYTMME